MRAATAPRQRGNDATFARLALVRQENLFDELLDAFEAGEHQPLTDLWTRFETDLLRHLDFEKKFSASAWTVRWRDEAHGRARANTKVK
jgi:hypothetical protein